MLYQDLSLSSLLQLLHLRLPIELGIKAQQLPSFLDTDQSLSRVLCFRSVIDIREVLLDELSRGSCESDIGVCDIEDVGSL